MVLGFRLPLDRNSRFVFIWDTLNCVAIHISYIFVWFQAAFDASSSWHLAVIYALDFAYLIYVLSQFFTSYKDKGRIVRDRSKIAKQVLKTIILDVLSLLPLEFLSAFSDRSDIVAAYFRLNRSLRYFRVYKFLERMESNITTSSFFWASLKVISVSLLSMHLWSCIWYMIACDNVSEGGYCTDGTWANTDNLNYGINMNEAGSYRRYLASYYWSITTITTVGYGEIHPQNWKERLTALICMIVECTKLSVILGDLAALLTMSEIKAGSFRYHLRVVQEHMLNMTLPETLRKRVIDRYEYMWKQSKGEEIEKLLLMLPPNLQTALFTETHESMLDAIAMQFMQRNSRHYLRQLSQMIKPTIFLPGEIILKKGEFGDSLCYLQRGFIEVVDGRGQVKHRIQAGDSFGKINLLFKTISTVTLRAGSLCELASLSASNFRILKKHYPIIGLQLRTALKTHFVQGCAHAKENLKNYQPENSLLDVDSMNKEENMDARSMGEDLEKANVKCFSKKESVFWRYIRKWIDITITPGSKFYVLWNGFMFLVVLLTVWAYCYLAAFTGFKPSTSYRNHRVRFAFTYLIDILFMADMVVSMKLAYEGANAIIIDQPWAVFKHYVRSWKFMLDFSAILPIEIFSLVWDDPWKYVALYKLNRILKWWKLWHILEDDLSHSIRVTSSKVHFLRMLVYIPTITHIGACVWFMVACFQEGKCLKNSWAHQQGINVNTSAIHDYVISLYWSTTTMTTVGYGDITPYNDIDKILAITAMVVGTLLYGYILGAIAATLTSAFASKVAYQERLQVVKKFIAQYTGNKNLSKRIHHHYNLLWKQSRGEANYIALLLSDLPESLREEVLLSDLQETIENIPWFTNTDPVFLKKLASNMIVYQHSPGDFIMYHGDICSEMYCVKKGIVEVLSEDLSHVIAKIGPGGYFGELCLLSKLRSIVTARAATHCEILGIDRTELETILREFPMIQRQLHKISREYRKKHITRKLATVTSRNAKIPPRSFVTHDASSALAVAMTVPISIVTRQSILPRVVAGFTDNKSRNKLACPLSTPTYPDNTFLRYSSSADKVLTLDEIGIALKKGKQAQLMRLFSNRKRESQIEGIADDYRRSSLATSANQNDEMSLQYLGGNTKDTAKLCLSAFLLPYVVLPKSKASIIWEIMMSILSFVSCLAVSLQASFFITNGYLWAVNYTVDLLFAIDMFLKLHTAYFNAEGILVTAPVKCAVNYFNTNFFIDLICNFPTEVISLAIWNGDNLLGMIALMRLNRLVRAYKLVLLFEYLENRISLSSSYFKTSKFIVFLAIGTHWIACYWFMVACSDLTGGAKQIDGVYTCTRDGWARQETALTPFVSNDSVYKRYVTTVYWASATSTSVGYGDIIAYTDFERLYALLIMITAVISYGYMLGSIAASLTNTGSAYGAFKEKVSAIKLYMKDNKVDKSMIQEVVNHYEYLWERRKGVDLQNIFEGLPVSLKSDLALNLHKELIEQITIFKDVDKAFLKSIALACKPAFFLRGQYILKKGDIGNAMYFISRGEVKVLSGEDDSILITNMKAGDFFGEVSCFVGCLTTATVMAKTNCDLYMLSTEDLRHCLQHYPQVEELIKYVAIQRYEESTDIGLEDQSSRADQLDNDDEQRFKLSYLDKFVLIDPESYFGLTIAVIGHIMVLFTLLMLPYQAVFFDNTPAIHGVTYLAELYFVTELILNFFTFKYDKDGIKITTIRQILSQYLQKRNGVILDILPLMPFEICALPISDGHTRMLIFQWLRMHKMLRIFRLIPFMRAHGKQQFRNLMSVGFIAIAIQCVLLLTLSTHWCACIWYLIACPSGECKTGTWASSLGITNSTEYHYLTSLYWSVTTLTTTGYGEISATNKLEMIVSSCIMIIGKLMFGYILGNVASEISNWTKNQVEFKGKVAAVKKYMKQKKISPSLQAHVIEYLDYIWARKRNVHYHTLLNDMSFCMQADIAMAGTEGLLRKVPLFADIDEAFLRRLSLTLKKFFYLPNQYIVVTRDINYDLYIVQEGNVRVITNTSSRQTLLSRGGYFGLNSFYNKHQKEVTAIAKNHVDVIVVRKSDFDQLLEQYPTAQQHLDAVTAYHGSLPSFGQGAVDNVLETTV